jgi:hypothetical protein
LDPHGSKLGGGNTQQGIRNSYKYSVPNHFPIVKTMQIFTLVIILVAVHIVQGTPGLTRLALDAVKATTKSAAKKTTKKTTKTTASDVSSVNVSEGRKLV